MGDPNDGYLCSSVRLKAVIRKRPETVKRRILEMHPNICSTDLRKSEQRWLDFMQPSELCGIRYYNRKKVAVGGDTLSALTAEERLRHKTLTSIASRRYWDTISSRNRDIHRVAAFGGNKFDRSYMVGRNKVLCSKRACVKTPGGELIVIENVAEFCQKQKLNYGNFKSMLRGSRKTCSGYEGSYVE